MSAPKARRMWQDISSGFCYPTCGRFKRTQYRPVFVIRESDLEAMRGTIKNLLLADNYAAYRNACGSGALAVITPGGYEDYRAAQLLAAIGLTRKGKR